MSITVGSIFVEIAGYFSALFRNFANMIRESDLWLYREESKRIEERRRSEDQGITDEKISEYRDACSFFNYLHVDNESFL